MKLLLFCLLVLASTSNVQLIKISGKIYDKVTTSSSDGTSPKAAYTPIDQPQLLTETKTPEPLLGKVLPAVTNLLQLGGGNQNNKGGQNAKVNRNGQQAKNMQTFTVKVPAADNKNENERYSIINNFDEQHLTVTESDENNKPAIYPAPTVNKISAEKLQIQNDSHKESKFPNLRANIQMNPNIQTVPIIAYKAAVTPQPASHIPIKTLSETDYADIEHNIKIVAGSSVNLRADDTNSIANKGNVVDGTYNNLIGNKNVISNSNNNQIKGDQNVISHGNNNAIMSDGSFMAGSRDIIY